MPTPPMVYANAADASSDVLAACTFAAGLIAAGQADHDLTAAERGLLAVQHLRRILEGDAEPLNGQLKPSPSLRRAVLSKRLKDFGFSTVDAARRTLALPSYPCKEGHLECATYTNGRCLGEVHGIISELDDD